MAREECALTKPLSEQLKSPKSGVETIEADDSCRVYIGCEVGAASVQLECMCVYVGRIQACKAQNTITVSDIKRKET